MRKNVRGEGMKGNEEKIGERSSVGHKKDGRKVEEGHEGKSE